MNLETNPITTDYDKRGKSIKAIPHEEIFQSLLVQIEKIDFRKLADKDEKEKLGQKYYLTHKSFAWKQHLKRSPKLLTTSLLG